MPTYKIKVKWGKELFSDVEANTDEEPMLFKAQLMALTGVQPERQKVMMKGAILGDEAWDKVKLRDGATMLLMGTKDEDMPAQPLEKTKFVEDMDDSELSKAMDLPAGLQNLGNTCYMNATVQCLKTIPELRDSLTRFSGHVSLGGGDDSTNLTASLRDLYSTMDKGRTIPPIILLQVLHTAFPRFAERGEQGGFQQQDANECWGELLRCLQEKAPKTDTATASRASAVDQFMGIECEAEFKCDESETEDATKSVEKFLQYSCHIDKDVKYLHTGLKNRLMESVTKHSPSLDRNASYTKTLAVSRLPGYLTIQMVRFHFKMKEGGGGINAKVLKDIKFPVMLDMFDMCSTQLQDKLRPRRTQFKEYEDWLVENNVKADKKVPKPELNMDERVANEIEESEDWWFEDDVGSNNSGYYVLQAVLTHKGRSSNSGHYVGWVKQKGEVWLKCDDDEVSPVHEEDVLKLSGGGDWHTAYLLVYGPRKLPKERGQKKEITQSMET